MTQSWPPYKPAVFSTSQNVTPADLYTLNRVGLPRNPLGVGMMLTEPVGVDVPGCGYLIRFATGFHTGIYFDPLTDKVLEVTDPDWPGPKPKLINSSLAQYVRTERFILEAFPFTREVTSDADDAEIDAVMEERIAVAARIRDVIREIDPAAMAPHGFWDGFASDIAIGNYSTENNWLDESEILNR